MEVIVTGGTMTAEEQQHYIRYVSEKYPHVDIQKLYLAVDGEFVNISIEPRKRVLTKMGGAITASFFPTTAGRSSPRRNFQLSRVRGTHTFF